MCHHRFPVLDNLIQEVENIAAAQPISLPAVVTMLHSTLASEIDPYSLAAVLIEGIAATLATKLPSENRGEAAIASVRLLRDRLRHYGAI
jgi:hypothetical protein